SFDGCTSAIPLTVPLTVSASVRSPVCSMSSGSRRASKSVAGNARRSGPCCVPPPIKAPLASARHRLRHGNASPGRYGCVAVFLGSDAWRRLGGPLCHSRPIRQDLLDRVAWTEIVKLLEEPGVVQSELDPRLGGARHTDPTKRREDGL